MPPLPLEDSLVTSLTGCDRKQLDRLITFQDPHRYTLEVLGFIVDVAILARLVSPWEMLAISMGTLILIVCHQESLTLWAQAYFLGEILVILSIAGIEWRVARMPK